MLCLARKESPWRSQWAGQAASISMSQPCIKNKVAARIRRNCMTVLLAQEMRRSKRFCNLVRRACQGAIAAKAAVSRTWAVATSPTIARVLPRVANPDDGLEPIARVCSSSASWWFSFHRLTLFPPAQSLCWLSPKLGELAL